MHGTFISGTEVTKTVDISDEEAYDRISVFKWVQNIIKVFPGNSPDEKYQNYCKWRDGGGYYENYDDYDYDYDAEASS